MIKLFNLTDKLFSSNGDGTHPNTNVHKKFQEKLKNL